MPSLPLLLYLLLAAVADLVAAVQLLLAATMLLFAAILLLVDCLMLLLRFPIATTGLLLFSLSFFTFFDLSMCVVFYRL